MPRTLEVLAPAPQGPAWASLMRWYRPSGMVLQLRSAADPSLIVDAAALWDQPERVLARFGAQADTDLLLALRRGAAVWPPLAVLLEQAGPAVLELDDDAVASLLGPAAEELAGTGIEVLWPASLGDGLKLQAVPTPAPERLTEAGFSLDALLEFRWQLTLGGEALDADEIAELAEAKRPLIRLRGRWVTLDPVLLAKLRQPPRTRMRAMEALGVVLAGSAEIDGETVTVVADGPLADFADRVARIAAAPPELPPPPGLEAALRPYQQRGVAWLAAMCDAGLGGCLADDMGLGKTIQVIALHLHRRAVKAGPTLVVCPASLLGTWEREVRRFAPDVPVRRYHGGGRHLRDVAADEIVLVTYGVVLRDSAELAGIGWGLVAADEAQHAKNPLSRTARELRALPAPGPDRADRHAGGEPAVGAVVDPGLEHTRAARPTGVLHPPGSGPGRTVPGRRGNRPVRRAGTAVPVAAQEIRPGDRAGTAAQDGDGPDRAANRRAGHPV